MKYRLFFASTAFALTLVIAGCGGGGGGGDGGDGTTGDRGDSSTQPASWAGFYLQSGAFMQVSPDGVNELPRKFWTLVLEDGRFWLALGEGGEWGDGAYRYEGDIVDHAFIGHGKLTDNVLSFDQSNTAFYSTDSEPAKINGMVNLNPRQVNDGYLVVGFTARDEWQYSFAEVARPPAFVWATTASPQNLAGKWTGHYARNGYEIRLDFKEDGSLSGSDVFHLPTYSNPSGCFDGSWRVVPQRNYYTVTARYGVRVCSEPEVVHESDVSLDGVAVIFHDEKGVERMFISFEGDKMSRDSTGTFIAVRDQ